MAVRHFCVESFHVSTNSMETALHKGDYILVNKLPLKDNPGRNRVVLFTSPLLKDSVSTPLFLSRCIGMPGDTIRVASDGYLVTGVQVKKKQKDGSVIGSDGKTYYPYLRTGWTAQGKPRMAHQPSELEEMLQSLDTAQNTE